ncbi:MAG: DNA topology modulation protein [Bacteroidota bacterium]
MDKIMIIGCSGAGKSTFSTKLHEITAIELIHLDQHHWLPNWVGLNKSDWRDKVTELSEKESWIMDGNYGGTMEIRLNKANTIIFMDRTRWLCLYRVLKRVITHYGKSRKDMPEGCVEKFSWEFMHYIYHYNKTRRPKILEKLSKLKTSKEIVILRSNKEIRGYLADQKKRHATLYKNNSGLIA